MPAGRPTKYDPKYAGMLMEYFDVPAGYDAEVENSKGVLQSVRHAADFPTFAGFANSIDVHRETLLNWADTDENGEPLNPEFFDAYKKAKDHQERILIQNGLKGGYHPAFAIFTAKNVIGWRDKQELDHSSSDRSMSPPQAIMTTDPVEAAKEYQRIMGGDD